MARKRGLYSVGTAEGLEGATGGLFKGLQFAQQANAADAEAQDRRYRDILELAKAKSGSPVIGPDGKVIGQTSGIDPQSSAALNKLLGLPDATLPAPGAPPNLGTGKPILEHSPSGASKTPGMVAKEQPDGTWKDPQGNVIIPTTADRLIRLAAPVKSYDIADPDGTFTWTDGTKGHPTPEPGTAKPYKAVQPGILDRITGAAKSVGSGISGFFGGGGGQATKQSGGATHRWNPQTGKVEEIQ